MNERSFSSALWITPSAAAQGACHVVRAMLLSGHRTAAGCLIGRDSDTAYCALPVIREKASNEGPVLVPKPKSSSAAVMSAIAGIVLQKSKVAGLKIFRETTTQRATADSYDLNRVTEVACEFCVRP
ncbi:hypothetical protein ABIB85_007812 [Bradyrhizobium sp. JR1.5]|jgi:hypothetical protein|uniref:hypothetical protein n=1 Tax=unclassified Bradyrhizobium TaxID=2631580 RepID=UPI003391E9F0